MESILRICSKCKTNQSKIGQTYCPSCISLYAKERYQKKKKEIIDYQKKYFQENKEKVLAKRKEYQKLNQEKIKSYASNWRKLNSAKVNANCKKRRAMAGKATPHWLTEDDFWMIEQAYELAQLRTKMLGIKFHVDHILPIMGKTVCGLHVPSNLQVIPALQNYSKGNRFFNY